MKKIAVLQIITGLGFGGAERVVFDLSRNISKDRFNIFVLSLSKQTQLLNSFIKQGITTYSLNINKTPYGLIKTIFYLYSFVKRNKIDIIHCHMLHAMIVSVLLKSINWNIKIVYTSHNVEFGSNFRKMLIFLLKPFRTIDVLFSKDMLRSFYKKENIVIHNGIDLSNYELNCSKNNKFTLIAVGRLENVKNHFSLIDIAEKIKTKFDFNLIIVGDGELKNELQKKIREKNIDDCVMLLGYKNNIAELLCKSHLFVMTSKWEGLPISLLEAAAIGLPILTTPVGSIPSLINKQTGFLCNVTNFPKEIYYIYQHYNEALKRADKLKKLIQENYSLEMVVSKHEKLYSSLI